MQNVSRFASGILTPDPFVMVIVHVGKINGRYGSIVRGTRGNPDNSNRVLCGRCGCLRQEGMKEVGKKEMTQIVNSQL
jgi:hypothetical protein